MGGWLLGLVLVAGLAGCDSTDLLEGEIALQRETLEQRLALAFPLKHKTALVAVEWSQPRVRFKSEEGRIGLLLDVAARPLGDQVYEGTLEIDGHLEFRQPEKAFFLTQVEVRKMQIADLPPLLQGGLGILMGGVVDGYLDQYPVYSLRQDNWAEYLVGHAVDSVRVDQEQLVIELGL